MTRTDLAFRFVWGAYLALALALIFMQHCDRERLLALTQPVQPLRDVYPEARADQLVGTPQEQLIEAAGD